MFWPISTQTNKHAHNSTRQEGNKLFKNPASFLVRAFEDPEQDYFTIEDALSIHWSTPIGIVRRYLEDGRVQELLCGVCARRCPAERNRPDVIRARYEFAKCFLEGGHRRSCCICQQVWISFLN